MTSGMTLLKRLPTILSNRSRALILAHSPAESRYYATPQNFFLRYISPSMPVLSSTNSANAGMMRAQKIVEWNRLALFLYGGGEK